MYSQYPKLTPPLLRRFIGVLIYIRLMKLPSYRDYWVQSGPQHTLYGTSFAKRHGFSRNVFQSIMSFLHVSDIDNENRTDRLTKVRPMLEHLNERAMCLYQPYENVAIDERMVKSKARFSFQQYIKNKPVKRGFKLWCLCDSKNGYTCRVQVYRGKDGEPRTH